MPRTPLLAAVLLASILLSGGTAAAAGPCEISGAQFLAGAGGDGIGGTGRSGDDDGIGGTGHSDPDGIGGTGHSGPDGIGGTGHSGPDGIGGTGLAEVDGIGGTGHSDPDGIGGTGVYGTLTGFGSLCVNGIHILLEDQTQYLRNGETSALTHIAIGQVLWVKAHQTSSGLYAQSVAAYSAVVGRVTAVDAEAGRVVVEGQAVVLDPAYTEKSVPAVGDVIDVSGLRNELGEIVASRVDLLPAGTSPYQAPRLRELVESAPELALLSVEGFLGPEIQPDRYEIAGLQIEAPELARLTEDTRVWVTGSRLNRDRFAASRIEFKPATETGPPSLLAPDRIEPIRVPGAPNGDSKTPGKGDPSAQIKVAPTQAEIDELVPGTVSNGKHIAPVTDSDFEIITPDATAIDAAVPLEFDVEILVDDDLIAEMIGLPSDTEVRGLGGTGVTKTGTPSATISADEPVKFGTEIEIRSDTTILKEPTGAMSAPPTKKPGIPVLPAPIDASGKR